MRFVVDNMLPRSLAEFLVAEGHDAHTAGLLRIGTDEGLWHYAEKHKAAVISKDSDFVQFAHRASHAKLIHVRGGNMTTANVVARFRHHLPEILAALARGETIIEVR